MDSHEIVKLFAEISVLGAIVWLFVRSMLSRMQDADAAAQSREERISCRVTTLETFINEKLLAVVEGSTRALVANTDAMKRTCAALEAAEKMAIESHQATTELLHELKTRPCLKDAK